MQLITTLLAITSTTLAATVALNTSAEYRLVTSLKANQTGKEQYDCLYLTSYHTGAGLNDVVFTPSPDGGERGYLGSTNVTGANGTRFYNQLFDLGSDFPWGLDMAENVNFYAAWQPVRLNAGVSGSGFEVSGFYLDDSGLQWTSSPSAPGTSSDAFGGWLVCDWWHGAPQLFFRISYYDTPAPSSCADVYLVPEYVDAAASRARKRRGLGAGEAGRSG